MKHFFDKPWFYKALALIIAIFLVAYVDNTQTGYTSQSHQNKTQQTATRSQTITVPLQVSVNTDKYFVVGYPEKVKLTIDGPASLVTSTVNTQTFRVYIDLTKLSIGRHTVPLKISGLSNQLSYSINPSTVSVNIQKRKSRSFPVQIEYNKSAVANGYHVGSVKSDPKIVNVTGARSEVDQIDRVVAKVNLPSNSKNTFERQVILIAQDAKGRQLNVVIDPAAVNINIPIALSHKNVKVKLNSQNENSDKVYSLTASQDSVEIYGPDEVLKKIKEVDADVDLKDVVASQTKSIKLKIPNGVIKASRYSVDVDIKVANNSEK